MERKCEGMKYSGEQKYIMHIPMPPQGFWSLMMYDKDFFFVPNALNRYTVSQRDKLKQVTGYRRMAVVK